MSRLIHPTSFLLHPFEEPAAEMPGTQARQAAPPIDPRGLLQEPARRPQPLHEVDQRREPRAESIEIMNVGHQPMTERARATFVIRLQELGLELGHVHVAGALGFARLAHQA